MRAPLSWLKDFTPLAARPSDEQSIAELVTVLDSLGLVVERVESVGAGLDEVVLSRVLEIVPIKGASRIRLVTVDAGEGDPLEIVCGATNFAIGDVVPLAKVGTTLPGGMRIERRKMLGVTSNGMLCSGEELGLNDAAMGLLILSSPGSVDARLGEGLELGRSIGEYLGIERDVVFDIAVEPNRPDALSMVGIARDLAARLRLPFVLPSPAVKQAQPAVAEVATAVIHDERAGFQLVARALSNLSPVVSPPIVARRVVLAGMRSINAVVDASNYVMLELGQPTHPYDLDRLGGHGIGVRLAKTGEHLITLDDKDHVLGIDERTGSEVSDAVITDALDQVVGLAGIMGGASSEIGAETRRVLLEVAEFPPLLLGETSSRQGLRTDAFVRFWRGVDSEGLVRAADRFAELVVRAHEHAGAPAPVVHEGLIEDRPVRRPPTRLSITSKMVNRLLGTELSDAEVADYLEPIGFKVTSHGEELEVEVPSFRPDATRTVDLIEEVARHYGYEQIERRERRSERVGALSAYQRERRVLRRLLVGIGALEAWTSSIVDPHDEEAFVAHGDSVMLTNPIVANEAGLRRQILPGLVKALEYNIARRTLFVRMFEIGRVFEANQGDDRPFEHEQLAVLFAEADDGAAAATEALKTICDGLRVDRHAFSLEQPSLSNTKRSELMGMHPSRSAVIVRSDDNRAIGVVGELDPLALLFVEPPNRRVGALVVDLGELLSLERRSSKAVAVSRFPSSDIDLAFVLDEQVPARALERVLEEAAGTLLESVRLIDVYRGKSLPEKTRSLTYRLRLASLERTLSDSEIASLRAEVIQAVEATLPARLRG